MSVVLKVQRRGEWETCALIYATAEESEKYIDRICDLDPSVEDFYTEESTKKPTHKFVGNRNIFIGVTSERLREEKETSTS